MFSIISNKIGDRPGGYTRIIKLSNRFGDGAEICFIELVDSEWIELVEMEIHDLFSHYGISEIIIIQVSAINKLGINKLKNAII